VVYPTNPNDCLVCWRWLTQIRRIRRFCDLQIVHFAQDLSAMPMGQVWSSNEHWDPYPSPFLICKSKFCWENIVPILIQTQIQLTGALCWRFGISQRRRSRWKCSWIPDHQASNHQLAFLYLSDMHDVPPGAGEPFQTETRNQKAGWWFYKINDYRHYIILYNIIPVVPHKAVAEVSKIGNL